MNGIQYGSTRQPNWPDICPAFPPGVPFMAHQADMLAEAGKE